MPKNRVRFRKNQQGRSMLLANPILSDPFFRPTVTTESHALVEPSMRRADCGSLLRSNAKILVLDPTAGMQPVRTGTILRGGRRVSVRPQENRP
jgi:hypothetical protein